MIDRIGKAIRIIGRIIIFIGGGLVSLWLVAVLIYFIRTSQGNNGDATTAQTETPPQPIMLSFRDLVIDGKELAQQGTPVIISGAYEEFGGIESLSPPHSVFSTDMVRLDTSNTPREIREFLYSCHQRAETAETNGLFLATCEVRITGTLTTCSLAIAPSVKLPCIEVEKAEAERPDSSSGTPATSVQQ